MHFILASQWTFLSGQEITDYYSSDWPEISKPQECDSSTFLTSRIIGGAETIPHAYNFAVRIHMIVDNKVNTCGGSLIAQRWVLTGKSLTIH